MHRIFRAACFEEHAGETSAQANPEVVKEIKRANSTGARKS